MAVNQCDTVAYAMAVSQTNVSQQVPATAAMGNAGAAIAGTNGTTTGGVYWWAAYSAIGTPPNRIETVNQQNGQYFNTEMLPSK